MVSGRLAPGVGTGVGAFRVLRRPDTGELGANVAPIRPDPSLAFAGETHTVGRTRPSDGVPHTFGRHSTWRKDIKLCYWGGVTLERARRPKTRQSLFFSWPAKFLQAKTKNDTQVR